MDPFQTTFDKSFEKNLGPGLWTWSRSKGQAQEQVQDLVLNGRAGGGGQAGWRGGGGKAHENLTFALRQEWILRLFL